MNIKRQKFITNLFYLILILVTLVSGCGGTASNPGGLPSGDNPELAPPAPPPQLPTFVKFPKSIAEISTDVLFAGTTGALATYTIGEDVSASIDDIALFANRYYAMTDLVLEPLNQLDIPVGFDSTFESVITVEGSRLVNVKIDFSNYENRGCSGNTAALPICYRIWMDGERSIYGQFDTFPTETNAGNGDLTGTVPYGIFDTGDPFYTIALEVFSLRYQLEDPLSKEIEFAGGFHPDLLNLETNFKITQEPNADSLLKTIWHSTKFIKDESTTVIEHQIFRWIDDEIFIGGFEETEGDPDNFDPFCAVISTGLVVDRNNCIQSGVDVGDLEPILFLGLMEFVYPADFPEQPSF